MLVSFKYKNHNGQEAIRHVEVESLDFLVNPGFGYQPGWFLSGICQDKKERRSFALSHIVLINNAYSQTINLRESGDVSDV